MVDDTVLLGQRPYLWHSTVLVLGAVLVAFSYAFLFFGGEASAEPLDNSLTPGESTAPVDVPAVLPAPAQAESVSTPTEAAKTAAPVIEPMAETMKPLAETAESVPQLVSESVVQPVRDTEAMAAKTVSPVIEPVAEEAMTPVARQAREATEPVAGITGSVAETLPTVETFSIVESVGETVEAVGPTVPPLWNTLGTAIEALGPLREPIGETAGWLILPSQSLPDTNLPLLATPAPTGKDYPALSPAVLAPTPEVERPKAHTTEKSVLVSPDVALQQLSPPEDVAVIAKNETPLLSERLGTAASIRPGASVQSALPSAPEALQEDEKGGTEGFRLSGSAFLPQAPATSLGRITFDNCLRTPASATRVFGYSSGLGGPPGRMPLPFSPVPAVPVAPGSSSVSGFGGDNLAVLAVMLALSPVCGKLLRYLRGLPRLPLALLLISELPD